MKKLQILSVILRLKGYFHLCIILWKTEQKIHKCFSKKNDTIMPAVCVRCFAEMILFEISRQLTIMISYSRISEARQYVNLHFNHHLDFQPGRYMRIRYTVQEFMIQCVCVRRCLPDNIYTLSMSISLNCIRDVYNMIYNC